METVVCSQTYFWSGAAKGLQSLKEYVLANEFVLERFCAFHFNLRLRNETASRKKEYF